MSGPQSKTIDGLAVTCAALSGWDGYALLPELAAALGPLLAQRAALAKVGKSPERQPDLASILDMDIDLERLFVDAGRALGGGKLPELMVRLLKGAIVVVPGSNGSGQVKYEIVDAATFNAVFSGERFWSAIKVAAFAFRVTFGNFSSALGQLADAAPTQ